MADRVLPLPGVQKEGYPWLGDDPAHPLWEEQQAGWPNMTPEEAMRLAVEHQKSRRADSSSHPAYDPGYIVNNQATRPNETDPAPVVRQTSFGKGRR